MRKASRQSEALEEKSVILYSEYWPINQITVFQCAKGTQSEVEASEQWPSKDRNKSNRWKWKEKGGDERVTHAHI